MNKKYVVLGLFIFLSVITLTGGRGGAVPAQAALINFSKQIERGDLDNLSLRIYYMYPSMLTPFPVSVEALVNTAGDDRVQTFVNDGNSLAKHIGLLKQVGNITLIPVKEKSYIDARIYYVFETNKGNKIFDVTMWGWMEEEGDEEECIYFNGFPFKQNAIFYDLIIPFLPEDEANTMEGYKQWYKEQTTDHSE
jgi:hypothetical protein